jgi:hypothetical protein
MSPGEITLSGAQLREAALRLDEADRAVSGAILCIGGIRHCTRLGRVDDLTDRIRAVAEQDVVEVIAFRSRQGDGDTAAFGEETPRH